MYSTDQLPNPSCSTASSNSTSSMAPQSSTNSGKLPSSYTYIIVAILYTNRLSIGFSSRVETNNQLIRMVSFVRSGYSSSSKTLGREKRRRSCHTTHTTYHHSHSYRYTIKVGWCLQIELVLRRQGLYTSETSPNRAISTRLVRVQTHTHLKTQVQVRTHGTLQTKCDVTAAVAAVIALGIVCVGERRVHEAALTHRLEPKETRKRQKRCWSTHNLPSAILLSRD